MGAPALLGAEEGGFLQHPGIGNAVDGLCKATGPVSPEVILRTEAAVRSHGSSPSPLLSTPPPSP